MNNSQAKLNTSKSNESCLASTSSILMPPKSFLESQKLIRGTSLAQDSSTTEPRGVGFFGLDPEKNFDLVSKNLSPANSHFGINDVTDKTLNSVGNDTRRHFISNNPNGPSSGLGPHASSTPKTAKKPFFNPFFSSSPPGLVDHEVKPKGNPDPSVDMEVDNSVELISGYDSNNFDDSRFSDNTQFMLLASEKPEDVPPMDVEKNKTEGVELPAVEGAKGGAAPLDDASRFHEEVLAGSQLMEEFMQNTFDANGKYGSGKIASTPKTKPPSASTPRDVGSAPKGKKNTPRVARDGTFSDVVVHSKLYCQVIPRPGKPRGKTNDSEKKKKKLDMSKKENKSTGKAIVDDVARSDLQERKQNCSLLLDGRAPYSEEMFDDDDDDLVFEAPDVNLEKLARAKDLPTDCMTSCGTKQSEPKQIDPADRINSFTKLKTVDSHAILNPPVDLVDIRGGSKSPSGPDLAPVFEAAKDEPLFEENELFDSFFDQSGVFNAPGLEKQDLEIVEPDRAADPKSSLYNDELITPTAAAQLFDSIIFDEQDEKDLPTSTIIPKKPETSTKNHQNQTPARQGEGRVTSKGFVDAGDGFRTPSSAAKKFKSFDDALSSQFDPDVEFVMKVFCDENHEGDGTKLKKWNKKAPKRHNSGNNSTNTRDSKSSVLSKIAQSPFDADDDDYFKTIETPVGLGPFTAVRPAMTSGPSSTNTGKPIAKTSTIGQTTCHPNGNIINDRNSTNDINESDFDDIVPPTPPGSPERSLSKAFCSGTTTPRRLLVGVVRPSPRASGKTGPFDDRSESPGREGRKKEAGSRKVNSSRRLDLDGCDDRGLL